MNVRVWTLEELDLAHPLPDGWEWSIASGLGEFDSTRPWAFGVGDLGVELDLEGRVVANDGNGKRFDPPADVALAVILASNGLDSMETMAFEVERRVSTSTLGGLLVAWRDVAAMLRRGTVGRSAESSAPSPVE
jgi:hypothetical protein